METSNRFVVPCSVQIPVASQQARFVVEKIMLLLLPSCEKASDKKRDWLLIAPTDSPIMFPLMAVTEPAWGVKGTTDTVPEELPLKVPLIAVDEVTFPCKASLITDPLFGLPGSP